MKPLWFLTYKTFLNGVKRALSSPRRLIGLLFFVGYYFMFFIRPALFSDRRMPLPGRLETSFELPPMQVIEAVCFGILAVLSLFMMMGVLSQQAGFKQSDVDVLFPTPVKPRVVLLFRMLRDYLLTLLFPLIILVLGLRPAKLGYESFVRNLPDHAYGATALRALAISWLLMAMCWIGITYAISLFINRSDKQSTRNKRILGYSIGIIVVGTIAYIGLRINGIHDFQDAIELLRAPLLRVVFFSATLATQLTIAPLTGDLWGGLLAGGALVGIIVGSLYVAMSQADWMYDQAAVKGFDTASVRAAQRRGDTMGALAEMARRGKIKAGRRTFVHGLKMQGPLALVWKEFFLQTRGMLGLLVMLALFGIAMCIMPALVRGPTDGMGVPALFFVMQASTLFMITLAISQTGFIEVLRRVDLQKPLPFSAPVIVFFEIAAKALLGAFVAVVAAIVAGIINPVLWPYVLAALLYSPALSLLLSASVFLVTIMFPDFEDPTQRQFRGIMMLIAIVVMGLPPTGAFLGLWALGLPAWSAATGAGIICLGVSALACFGSGKLYESYNPSE
jgi:hypothetical protein